MTDGIMEAARAQREWAKESGGVYWEAPGAHEHGYDRVLTLVQLRRWAVRLGGTTRVLAKSGYVVVDFAEGADLWAPAARPEGVSKRAVTRYKLVSEG